MPVSKCLLWVLLLENTADICWGRETTAETKLYIARDEVDYAPHLQNIGYSVVVIAINYQHQQKSSPTKQMFEGLTLSGNRYSF